MSISEKIGEKIREVWSHGAFAFWAPRVLSFIAVQASIFLLVKPAEAYNFQIRLGGLVTFIGAFSLFLSAEVKSYNKIRTPHPHDVALLEKLFQTLTPDNVKYIHKHDFLGGFDRSMCDAIHLIRGTWEGVDKEFEDSEVERYHKKLILANKRLSELIGQFTAPTGARFASVRVDKNSPVSDRDRQEGTAINDAADALYEAYVAFTRVARKRIMSCSLHETV